MGNQFTRFQCWDILQSNLRIPSRSWLSTAMLLQTSLPVWTPAYLLHDNQLASSTAPQNICYSLLKLQPTFLGTFLLKYFLKITMFTQTEPHFWFQEKVNPTVRTFQLSFSCSISKAQSWVQGSAPGRESSSEKRVQLEDDRSATLLGER